VASVGARTGVLHRAKSISAPPTLDQKEPPAALPSAAPPVALPSPSASSLRPSRQARNASWKLAADSASSKLPADSEELWALALAFPAAKGVAGTSAPPKVTRLPEAFMGDCATTLATVGFSGTGGLNSVSLFWSFTTWPTAMPISRMWLSCISMTTSMLSKPFSRKMLT